ncbi:hypothetical protein BDN70DRAFT_399064 [Pholiota conissans]|uniref:Uncharacterized protein n=1 Tax=Pholiota conissans TaxID=109636 RepID=A0A9P5YSQ3_9AGAR|nr:hypothetical protein BDN70DRAFT_399064 [Pholiota conissans]
MRNPPLLNGLHILPVVLLLKRIEISHPVSTLLLISRVFSHRFLRGLSSSWDASTEADAFQWMRRDCPILNVQSPIPD